MEASFKKLVEAVVAEIAIGKVMTYGQIAAICGNAKAARIVGGIAHYGNPSLPWHRVVNKSGGLASGFPGGRKAHFMLLKEESISMKVLGDSHLVDLDKHLLRADSE